MTEYEYFKEQEQNNAEAAMEENERLETEIERLKAENAALREAFEWALDRDDNVCGKCAYYIPPRLDENYTGCNHSGECVNGILEYFKKNG